MSLLLDLQEVSASDAALTFAAGLVFVALFWALYAGLTGPLSSIPGPFLSQWTDLPVRLSLLSGSKAHYVHSLHEKYGKSYKIPLDVGMSMYRPVEHAFAGPLVRLGPNQIDVSDPTAAREIHGARSGFIKDPSFYTGGKVSSLFSTVDPSFHAQRRRLLSPCFAEASMGRLESTALERAKLAVTKIGDELHTTGRADILKWWTLFAMDIISEVCFGEPFRMLELGKVCNLNLNPHITSNNALTIPCIPRKTSTPETSPRWDRYFPCAAHSPP
jgi:hypothetical protein